MQYHLTFDADRRMGPRFLLSGLEYDSKTGLLGLAGLPGDPLAVGPLYRAVADDSGLAGIALDDDGRLYVAGSASGMLRRVVLNPSGEVESSRPWPIGLDPSGRGAIHASSLLAGRLGLLWVAEPAANRVLGFDRATGTPRGEARGPLKRPTFLAADSRGRLYVADALGVSRFTPDGSPDPLPTPILVAPAGPIAVLPETDDTAGETLIVAIDDRLLRYSLQGDPTPWPGSDSPELPLRPDRPPGAIDTLDTFLNLPTSGRPGARSRSPSPPAWPVTALAAWEGKLWIGLVLDEDGRPGAVLHALDPVTLRLARVTSAGLDAIRVGGLAASDANTKQSCRAFAGRLLIHDPTTRKVISVRANAAKQSQGALLAGPFQDTAGLGRWYRLSAPGVRPEKARFRFLTLTTDPDSPMSPATVEDLATSNPPPAPPWYLVQAPPSHAAPPGAWPTAGRSVAIAAGDAPDTPAWTKPNRWREAADDLLDTRVWLEPSSPQGTPRNLWVAAFFAGDGTSTATLGPLTAEAGHRGWEGDLPAIYQRDSLTAALAQGDSLTLPPPTLLDGLLGLFEAAADIDLAAITGLPDWFDPRVTPDPQELARHLGLDPDGIAPDRLAEALGAFSAAADIRGTAEGLERAVRDGSGVEVRLVEPIQAASLWVLGETGDLGALTRLAPGPIQGATLDQTAILDQAHLADDGGASLWDDLVGRVVARVYRSEVRDAASLKSLERCLLDRAPAHASVVVEVVEARARLGYQAALGLDAVLASSDDLSRPLALGDRLGPGYGLEVARPSHPHSAAWLGRDALSSGDRSRSIQPEN